MNCLKCRRVTEIENITTASFKNGRLIRRGQCITRGKAKTQFVKEGAVGSFFNTLVNNLPCEMQTLLIREHNSIKDLIRMERQRKGVYR